MSPEQKVRNFTGWVKDNCSSSVDSPSGTSVSCRFNGRKRDLDSHTKATLDKACKLIEGNHYGWEEGISMDLVTDIFQEVDCKQFLRFHRLSRLFHAELSPKSMAGTENPHGERWGEVGGGGGRAGGRRVGRGGCPYSILSVAPLE